MKLVDIPTLDEYLENSDKSLLDNDIINIDDYKGLENNEIPSKYVGKFFLAGEAIITVINKETNNQFTYKVSKQQDNNNPDKFIWFVSVNSGYMEFQYIGLLFEKEHNMFDFRVSKRIINDLISVKSFDYLLSNYINNHKPHKNLHFYHIGKCCRCGRELTDSQSIILGIGPSCYQRL